MRDVMRSISAGLLSGIHRVSYTYIIKQHFFAMSRKFFAADTMSAAKRRFYTHFWQVCITLIAFWSLSPIPLFCTRSSKELLCFQYDESVKPEAVLSLYGRCAQRSLSYYITHPVHFPACVSQRQCSCPLSVINSRKASLCSVCRETQHTERYRN